MGPGDGNGGDSGQKKKERDALNKIVLHRFAADPLKVKVFGSVALSWNLSLPDSPFEILVHLNDEAVDPVGNATRKLVQTTTFSLTASTEHAARRLGSRTVNVDDSECRSHVIEAFAVTQPLKTSFDDRFRGSGKFRLQDNGTIVSLDTGKINIQVPLTINVPHWFDADMKIFIQLAVGVQGSVSAPDVRADVSWSFFENLASLGCGHFVQSGMSKISEVFLSDIATSELVPAVAAAIAEQAKKFTDLLTDADPQKREFVLMFVTVSSSSVKLTACPK